MPRLVVIGEYENFSKDNWGYETFWKMFEYCGMKYHFSIGFENFYDKARGEKLLNSL